MKQRHVLCPICGSADTWCYKQEVRHDLCDDYRTCTSEEWNCNACDAEFGISATWKLANYSYYSRATRPGSEGVFVDPNVEYELE